MKWLILSLLIINWTFSAQAADDFTGSGFSSIPILEGGRIKPMDTFARSKLLQFSSKSSYKGKSALQWFVQFLFTPETTNDDTVLVINHPAVLQALNLPEKSTRYFSFNELKGTLSKLHDLAMSAFKMKPEERSEVEKEIIRFYNAITAYYTLRNSMSFVDPHKDFALGSDRLAEYFELPPGTFQAAFYDLFTKGKKLSEVLVRAEKGDGDLDEFDRSLLGLAERLFAWIKNNRDDELTVIPLSAEPNKEWYSPWAMIQANTAVKVLQLELDEWVTMVRAYRVGNSDDFFKAVAAFKSSVARRTGSLLDPAKLSAETGYNKVDPFYLSKILFGFSFLLILLSFLFLPKWLYRVSISLLFLGFCSQTYGIIIRMFIMDRPPVTNLFETFVFVGWTIVLIGILLELVNRSTFGIISSSVSGFVMLMISGKYAAEGDTMGMLVAVLDSNFWLATHVITIAMGYAGCCLAGVFGHIYLVQGLTGRTRPETLKSTYRTLYVVLAFGLIFSFIGTVLGGIWADQSWGRFWGWDPKENGALLIVLWTSLIIHAKMSGTIDRIGVAVGSVIGIIVVMMAWFGINLLGVGLHSYGFTTGIAVKLYSYIAVEILFLLVTVPLAIRKKNLKEA